MNTVTVYLNGFSASGDHFWTYLKTTDVNEAMEAVHLGWFGGMTAKFVGPYGERLLEPPIESVINQLPDDSQARHDRNRARWK